MGEKVYGVAVRIFVCSRPAPLMGCFNCEQQQQCVAACDRRRRSCSHDDDWHHYMCVAVAACAPECDVSIGNRVKGQCNTHCCCCRSAFGHMYTRIIMCKLEVTHYTLVVFFPFLFVNVHVPHTFTARLACLTETRGAGWSVLASCAFACCMFCVFPACAHIHFRDSRNFKSKRAYTPSSLCTLRPFLSPSLPLTLAALLLFIEHKLR